MISKPRMASKLGLLYNQARFDREVSPRLACPPLPTIRRISF